MKSTLDRRTLPIGLFDSGVGGLTVLQELVDLLPNENLVYFGDTARLPYGNKSPEAVSRFAFENASFLLKQNIKLLVISCHTACSHAYATLKKVLPVPVLGVTEPGIESLLTATQTNSVAILATASTIGSNIFQSQLVARRPSLKIHTIACPLFVPLVEEGLENHSATRMIADHYLSGLRKTDVDSVLLACTHYPLLTSVIQSVLDPSVKIIAPAKTCATHVQNLLSKTDLLNPQLSTPYYQFYVSDDPLKFQYLSNSFFSKPIEKVDLVLNKIL